MLGPGGAVEAIEAARSAGLIRFAGITGHHCAVLRQALEAEIETLIANAAGAEPLYVEAMKLALPAY